MPVHTLGTMGKRICQLEGCNVDLDEIGKNPRAKYCGGAHRAMAANRRLGPQVRIAPSEAKALEQIRTRKTAPKRKPRPSDVRISYERIVAELSREMGSRSARTLADRMLTAAQRRRLESLAPCGDEPRTPGTERTSRTSP